MMALYDLSGGKDTECLEAAKGAASKLRERCMDLMWEANMTAAGVVGCQQLYQATRDPPTAIWRSSRLASVLSQAWLWECDFGIGESTTNVLVRLAAARPRPAARSSRTAAVRLHFKDYAALTRGSDRGQRDGHAQRCVAARPHAVAIQCCRRSWPKTAHEDSMAAEGRTQTNCGESGTTR